MLSPHPWLSFGSFGEECMNVPVIRNVWVALLLLFCVHTAVCVIADRLLSTRYTASPDTGSIETTTQEQRARGEHTFVMVTHRVARPISLVFYAIAGYTALLAAALWLVFALFQNRAA